MSDSESKMSPENLFKYDYINEVVGLDMSLQMLKSGSIDVDFFKSRCKEAIQNKGKLVLKFSEKYQMPVPAGFEAKVQAIDMLTDEINNWVDQYLKDESDKNMDELASMIKKVVEIVKPPKKVK